VNYKRGHWISTFRNQFEGDGLPPIEMRTNTRFRTVDSDFLDDAPSYRRFPLRLFGKLIAARVAMALGR